MANKKFVKGFYAQYKLAECCKKDDYRECFGYLLVDGRYIYATDGRVAVKANLNIVSNLTEAEIQLLDGKIIPMDTFKALQSEGAIEVTESGIVAFGSGYETTYTIKDKSEVKFPDVAKIMNDAAAKSGNVSRIGLSITRLNQLAKAIGTKQGNLKLDFISESSAVMVNAIGCKEDVVGLIMPMCISD